MTKNLKILDHELEEMSKSKEGVKKDNSRLNKKVIQLEQELFKSKTVGLKLIEQLKGCEQKIEELHNNSAIYVCRKKDTIDESLGAFLNQYPERGKLQILFIRESEGVYQFGQRRVYVKVEKGNQVYVKVGGGFMSVKEFVEKYTPLEVDKIKRNSVVHRINDKLTI